VGPAPGTLYAKSIRRSSPPPPPAPIPDAPGRRDQSSRSFRRSNNQERPPLFQPACGHCQPRAARTLHLPSFAGDHTLGELVQAGAPPAGFSGHSAASVSGPSNNGLGVRAFPSLIRRTRARHLTAHAPDCGRPNVSRAGPRGLVNVCRAKLRARPVPASLVCRPQ